MNSNRSNRAVLLLLFVVTAWVGHSALAQTKQISPQKRYKLSQLIPGNRDFTDSYPAYIAGLQWHGNKLMSFGEQGTKIEFPLWGGKAKVSKDIILTTADFAKAVPSTYKNPIGMPRSIETRRGHELLLTYREGLCRYDLDKRQMIGAFSTEAGQSGFDLSPTGDHALVLKEHNIYLIPVSEVGKTTAKPQRITSDGSEQIVYGEAVHQREFGIEKGTFWSPDGTKIAYYRMDQSMVAPYPLVDINARKATEIPVRYPMAGMPSHHVTVEIYDIPSESTYHIQTEVDPEQYLTNLSWSPDSRMLYISHVNRQQTKHELIAYETRTGQRTNVILQEEDPVYIEPLHPIYFVPGNPKQFILQTRRDGWNHLYLYDITGRLIRQLTHGEWEVTDFKGVDPKGRYAYYESTKSSPIERKLYRTAIQGGKSQCLTPEYGVHRTRLSADFSAFIDVHESPTVPRTSRILTTDGKKSKDLLVAPNPDVDYQMPEITVGIIKAADNSTDLYYRMVKPLDFDPTKKYPVIIYVYGGPHAQMIEDGWRHKAGGWDIYMAQLGYVVFTLDNRGSANRGKNFEQVIHRNLGVAEMADQMRGVDFLKSQPWIDADRIGIHGWSFGGFMTTNLMLTHPEVFKVGVAGGPVIDWSLYEIMYGERYMDTPQENPAGYKATCLSDRADQLKGRLMLIHGDIDPVVVWQHSLRFVQSCVKAGTYPDYMVYPGHEHNVSGPDRVHLYTTITRYFTDHL